jgi:hypothetical protein
VADIKINEWATDSTRSTMQAVRDKKIGSMKDLLE